MRGRVLGAALAAVLAACQGPGRAPPSPPRTSPPAAIPAFSAAEPPSRRDCFPPAARALGLPGFVPAPRGVPLQGPDAYAAPYRPRGQVPKRIEGEGFAFETSSRLGLVAGFYAACLDTYGDREHTRLRADGSVIFRVPLRQLPEPVVVVIADDPDGPTATVIFTEWELQPAAPPPSPSATVTGPPSPSPAGT